MKRTPLYDQHVRDASAVINLKGFARAMQYVGHVQEHRATRERVSLCDVSHMGELDFKGPDALALVQKLITNDAGRLAVNQALYSAMCDERGILLDDLVCFRLAADHFVWVVNVTKTDDDYQWVLKHAQGMDVAVRNISTDTALLALQGPSSREVLQRIAQSRSRAAQVLLVDADGGAHRARGSPLHDQPHRVHRRARLRNHGGPRPRAVGMGRAPDGGPAAGDRAARRSGAGEPADGGGLPPERQRHGRRKRIRSKRASNGSSSSRRTSSAGTRWRESRRRAWAGRWWDSRSKVRRTIRNGYRIYRNGKEIGRVTSGPLSAELDRTQLRARLRGERATPRSAPSSKSTSRGKRSRGRVVAMPFCARRVKDEPAVRTWSPYALRFSESHVWARLDEGAKDVLVVGLSDFGQRSLGDILCVELPKVGDRVTSGEAMGWVDCYRRAVRPRLAGVGRGGRGQRSGAAQSRAHQRLPVFARRHAEGARRVARDYETDAELRRLCGARSAAAAIRRMDQGTADDVSLSQQYRPTELHLLEQMIEGAAHFELFVAALHVHDLIAAEVAAHLARPHRREPRWRDGSARTRPGRARRAAP